MQAITYFKAYKIARDKMSFYQAQQGGDYSARRNKAQRQAAKFEQAIITVLTLTPEPDTAGSATDALYGQLDLGEASAEELDIWWNEIKQIPFE